MWTFEVIEPKHSRQILPDTVDMLTRLYQQGRTLEEIGQFIGVSRERIRQLIDTSEGGAPKKSRDKHRLHAERLLIRQRARERRIEGIFGCSYSEITRINGSYWNYGQVTSGAGKRATAFFHQRRFAERRGIAWELTFPEWWKIWEESDKWHARGRGRHSFCMSRIGDVGPYAVGNVRIVTNRENSGEARKNDKVRDELGFTKRERQVFDLMKSGVTSGVEIATRLGLAKNTIHHYMSNFRTRGLFQ